MSGAGIPPIRGDRVDRVSGPHSPGKDGFMAGKPLNRLELRRQNDAAEPLDPMEDESEELTEELDDEDGQEKRSKRKKAAPKAKTKAAKPSKPATRMRIVWVVMNDA